MKKSISGLSPRQVHLDFHTSPLIPDIGRDFDKADFQKALKEGHLSSITIFAKGHHGMCYYPTKIGKMHPGLAFDLTGGMMEAAHEIGVRAPVYITGGWSAYDAETHPEWCARDEKGNMIKRAYPIDGDPDAPLGYHAWIDLCLNDGSYAKHIYELTHEVCRRYPHLDGLFYDIIFVTGYCMCEECKAGMKAAGMNPESIEDAKRYYTEKHCDFMRKCGEILHSYHPDATIFFNSGGAEMYMPEYHFGSTHFEMEDLPTDWGGYDKMPIRARFFANSGKDYLGMTGKFHTSWGEFGGFKIGEALQYETACMLAYGARCSVGDQMHPRGFMDHDTYKNIGEAYSYIEKIEDYAFPASSTAKVGVYLSKDAVSDEGLAKMLLESQTDFDVVYENDYSRFDLVIFPDKVKLDEAGKKALQAYLNRGGRVIFSGESLVENGKFVIDAGIDYIGPDGADKDFVRVGEGFEGIPSSPFLFYRPAERVALRGAESMAEVVMPYFNRTLRHYCSHKNTPYDLEKETSPAMTRFGNILYIAHPVFAVYKEYGSLYHKRYFLRALKTMCPALPLEVDLMSAGRGVLNHQPEQRRYVAHFLYAAPSNRGAAEVLEDFPDLYNIPVRLRLPEKIKRVVLVPAGEEIPFEETEDGICFTLPHLRIHALVSVEY